MKKLKNYVEKLRSSVMAIPECPVFMVLGIIMILEGLYFQTLEGQGLACSGVIVFLAAFCRASEKRAAQRRAVDV